MGVCAHIMSFLGIHSVREYPDSSPMAAGISSSPGCHKMECVLQHKWLLFHICFMLSLAKHILQKPKSLEILTSSIKESIAFSHAASTERILPTRHVQNRSESFTSFQLTIASLASLNDRRWIQPHFNSPPNHCTVHAAYAIWLIGWNKEVLNWFQ